MPTIEITRGTLEEVAVRVDALDGPTATERVLLRAILQLAIEALDRRATEGDEVAGFDLVVAGPASVPAGQLRPPPPQMAGSPSVPAGTVGADLALGFRVAYEGLAKRRFPGVAVVLPKG